MNISDEYDIEQIQISLEQAEKEIAKADALERLKHNKDFQDLIEVDYLHNESARLTSLLDDAALPDGNDVVISALRGISALRRHFRFIEGQGALMRRAAQEHRDTMEEIRMQAVDITPGSDNE